MTENIFDTPEEPEIKFDRWGRYLLPSPITGARIPWTRATTFAKTIMDLFALGAWQQRMTAKGMSLRPDLVAMASTMDVKADKSSMDNLVEQAKDAAGQKVAANTGTALHGFTEELDRGNISLDDVPVIHRQIIASYADKLRTNGLHVVRDMIERVVCVPNYGVAGRLDRILMEQSGDYVIGDVKSGNSLQFGKLEVAVQLALYAHGVNMAGVYDPSTRRWAGVSRVRTDYAIVMHIPAGSDKCELIRVDIKKGWRAAQLCAEVRDWRKCKDLFSPYKPPGTDTPSWENRFRAVQSREEASKLFREASSVFGSNSEELARLVSIGLEALGMN